MSQLKKYNNAKELHRSRPWAGCLCIFDFRFELGNDLQTREKKHSSFQRAEILSHLLSPFFLTTSCDQNPTDAFLSLSLPCHPFQGSNLSLCYQPFATLSTSHNCFISEMQNLKTFDSSVL